MTELCGVVKDIVKNGAILIVEIDITLPILAHERWHISHFDRCHRYPIVGDKVYLFNNGGRWIGSFSSQKPNKTLNWQEVGF